MDESSHWHSASLHWQKHTFAFPILQWRLRQALQHYHPVSEWLTKDRRLAVLSWWWWKPFTCVAVPLTEQAIHSRMRPFSIGDSPLTYLRHPYSESTNRRLSSTQFVEAEDIITLMENGRILEWIACSVSGTATWVKGFHHHRERTAYHRSLVNHSLTGW